jgi:hypothetical protein
MFQINSPMCRVRALRCYLYNFQDFGADRSCHGATEEGCKVDSTAAFQNAIDYCGGEDSTPESWQTIYVPPGYYRIDGTITMSGQSMVLERGAILVRRRAITMNGDPLIRIVGTNGRLTGGGTLLSENPSHRGLLNIGPTNLTVYNNIEFNVVAGIHIHGAGTAAAEDCYSKVAGPVTCAYFLLLAFLLATSLARFLASALFIRDYNSLLSTTLIDRAGFSTILSHRSRCLRLVWHGMSSITLTCYGGWMI